MKFSGALENRITLQFAFLSRGAAILPGQPVRCAYFFLIFVVLVFGRKFRLAMSGQKKSEPLTVLT